MTALAHKQEAIYDERKFRNVKLPFRVTNVAIQDNMKNQFFEYGKRTNSIDRLKPGLVRWSAATSEITLRCDRFHAAPEL